MLCIDKVTEELRLWSIGDSGDVEPLKPLQQMPTELELEELLVRPGTYSVGIRPQAIHWGGDAFEVLRDAVDLRDSAHGGYVLCFKTGDEWDGLRPEVLGFVDAVMENRSVSGEVGT